MIPNSMHITVEDIDGVTVVDFTHKRILGERKIKATQEQLFSLIDKFNRKKLLLNFENVEYLSEATMSKLIDLQEKINKIEGKLVLCNIHPGVYEIFEVTKLSKFFVIVGDKKAGLESFKNSFDDDFLI